VPLLILYEASIWLAVLVERRSLRLEAASLTDP
jgi:Sec-independent protein secretion pathway component TatC